MNYWLRFWRITVHMHSYTSRIPHTIFLMILAWQIAFTWGIGRALCWNFTITTPKRRLVLIYNGLPAKHRLSWEYMPNWPTILAAMQEEMEHSWDDDYVRPGDYRDCPVL